jgi:hypothetical protein
MAGYRNHVSCGKDLPGRLGRLAPEGIHYLWPALRDVPDKWLWGSLWATYDSALKSNDLNAANHGHQGATYGPLQTDLGWATAIDLRPAGIAAEARHRQLAAALKDLRGRDGSH